MPEFKSTTYTAQETAQNNAGKIIADAALISGKFQLLQCEVTVPAGTVAADTILLGFLPAGAVVIPGQSSITTEVVAGANAIDIGVPGDSTAIAEAIVVNTLGSATLNSKVGSYNNTTRQPAVATLSDTLTAGGKFFLNIAYAFAE